MFVHLLIAALTEQAMCLNEYYFDFWGSILLHAGFNGSILYVIIHVVVSATKMQYTNLILFNGIAKVNGTAGCTHSYKLLSVRSLPHKQRLRTLKNFK